MAKDPILDALHKTREKYAARFKNDLKAIYRDLKAKEEQGKFVVVSHPPRRPRVKQSAKKRSQQRGAA
jgi:hypothetical protein